MIIYKTGLDGTDIVWEVTEVSGREATLMCTNTGGYTERKEGDTEPIEVPWGGSLDNFLGWSIDRDPLNAFVRSERRKKQNVAG